MGVINHAHEYNHGWVKEHLYAHLYHERTGKKGANDVSSLIMKMLRDVKLLHEDSIGSELNFIFDNCSGQNKNNGS